MTDAKMDLSKQISDILLTAKQSKVDLKTIPILREKLLFFRLIANRKIKWLIYMVITYFLLYRIIGFRVLREKVTYL